jgi:hypothetical protein
VLSVISLFNHASVTSLVVVGMIMHRRTACIRKVSCMNQISPFLLKSTVACLLPVCVFLYLRKQSIISMVALIGCCILYFRNQMAHQIYWVQWNQMESSTSRAPTFTIQEEDQEKDQGWRTRRRRPRTGGPKRGRRRTRRWCRLWRDKYFSAI